MAIERKWEAIPFQVITTDGNALGLITTDGATLFHVGQLVTVETTTQISKQYQIKRIASPNEIYLGDKSNGITDRADLSNILFAETATIKACEQNRPRIAVEEIARSTYQEEPAMARRVLNVDEFGNPVTPPLESTQQEQLAALQAICAKLEAQNSGDIKNIKIADEVISALTAVQSTSATNVALGQPLEPIANATILGIARTAAIAGAETEIITYGELSDSSFIWAAGTPLFLGSNGVITEIAPTTGVLTRLGQSMGPGRIFIDIQEPIKLP